LQIAHESLLSSLPCLCPAVLLKWADSEQVPAKATGSWPGTQWAGDLPGLSRRAERITSPLRPFCSQCNLATHRACWGTWTDTPEKAFVILSPFLFQGPIGLDGKPVSKQLLSRLSALPPARSHCSACYRVRV